MTLYSTLVVPVIRKKCRSLFYVLWSLVVLLILINIFKLSPGISRFKPRKKDVKKFDDLKSLTISNDLCSGSTSILILVPSTVENTNDFYNRQMIRRTWGDRDVLRSQNMRMGFLVGRAPQRKYNYILSPSQDLVELENARYRDIIQVPTNLTSRFLGRGHTVLHAALNYVWHGCAHVPLVVVINQTVKIDTSLLLRHIPHLHKGWCWMVRNNTSQNETKAVFLRPCILASLGWRTDIFYELSEKTMCTHHPSPDTSAATPAPQ